MKRLGVRNSRFGAVVGALALTGLLAPGAALAARPTIERIPVEDTFDDGILSEVCGVPVTTRVEGHMILRTFEGESTGVAEVFTINLGYKATSPYGEFRFRDVGADVLRLAPDGTMLLGVSGQVPFEFAGVLKLDLETGEVILEPRDRSEWQLARACAALGSE